MKFSDFFKKNDDLQKKIVNEIMNYDFDKLDCDEYGEHPSGVSVELLENLSDVPENRKWNVVSNAANAFTSSGSQDLAGLFPAWEEEWNEITDLWYEGEENGWNEE